MDKKTFLVGKGQAQYQILKPFDDIVCDFFDILSKNIFKDKSMSDYPDIISIAFWFRKKNILKLQKVFNDGEFKSALGKVFHITPNNVPINFAYSLFFGLITGNSNIVKVPFKNYPQVEYLCKKMNILLKLSKFNILKDMINIIRYENNDDITSEISNQCNARIIWGGDNTIKKIKSIDSPVKCVDIAFPDRYSFSIINLETLKNLNSEDFKKKVEKFYIDNYTFDQNACNSSHLVFWLGKKINQNIIEKFWIQLNILVNKKVKYPDIISTEKYNKICTDLINFSNIQRLKKYSKNLHVVTLNKLIINNEKQRGQWGYFYQYLSKDLNILPKIITNKYQTLIYYGFEKIFLKNFLINNQIKGVDRVIPMGRSMEMSHLWDGYNLLNSLTRIIDIK